MFVAKNYSAQDAAVSSRPVTLASPAPINSKLRQESQAQPFVFTSLRTLFLAPKSQPLPFQRVQDSLTHNENVTAAFPITFALCLRSCASVPCSTPFLSRVCALFV